MAIQDVWLWEMEMCCSMELEGLRKKMCEIPAADVVPGTVIDSGITACPHDEMLFEALRFWINVLENGSFEVVGRIFYWHAVDGGWNKTATLKTFNSRESCLEWLQDTNYESREECALIFKKLGR